MGSKEPRSLRAKPLLPPRKPRGPLSYSGALPCDHHLWVVCSDLSFIHSCIHSSVHQTPADFFLHTGPWLGARDTYPVLRHSLRPHRAQSPGRNRPKACYPNSGPCGYGVVRDGFLEEVDPEQTPEGQRELRTHSSLGRAVSGKEGRLFSGGDSWAVSWMTNSKQIQARFSSSKKNTHKGPDAGITVGWGGAEGPSGWLAGAWDGKRNGTWLDQRQDKVQV